MSKYNPTISGGASGSDTKTDAETFFKNFIFCNNVSSLPLNINLAVDNVYEKVISKVSKTAADTFFDNIYEALMYQGLDLKHIFNVFCSKAQKASRDMGSDLMLICAIVIVRGTNYIKMQQRSEPFLRREIQALNNAYTFQTSTNRELGRSDLTLARIASLAPNICLYYQKKYQRTIVSEPIAKALPIVMQCQAFAAVVLVDVPAFRSAYLWYAHQFDLVIKKKGGKATPYDQLESYCDAAANSNWMSKENKLDLLYDLGLVALGRHDNRPKDEITKTPYKNLTAEVKASLPFDYSRFKIADEHEPAINVAAAAWNSLKK